MLPSPHVSPEGQTLQSRLTHTHTHTQAASSSAAPRVFLDEETLCRLATSHFEDARASPHTGARPRSAYSEASTNLHASPPTDPAASFNPPLPTLDMAGLIDSVGNFFDANPANPRTGPPVVVG